MHENVTLNIDSELLSQANTIFESIGIDFSTATRMFLKKVIKERSILFLITSVSQPIPSDHDSQPFSPDPDNNMTKSRAKRLIYNKGVSLYNNVTFASKNNGAYNYWANPELSLLDRDWSLILNDWKNRKIYLFNIPAKSIARSEFVTRRDKPYLIDLQIMYEDPTFTDNRSGYSLLQYKVAEINY